MIGSNSSPSVGIWSGVIADHFAHPTSLSMPARSSKYGPVSIDSSSRRKIGTVLVFRWYMPPALRSFRQYPVPTFTWLLTAFENLWS